jgi:Cupin
MPRIQSKELVTRGTCWLKIQGAGEPIQLGGGDFVLLPKGSPHAIKDAPATPALPLEQVFGSYDQAKADAQPGLIVRYGGGGAATTLVAGYSSRENGAHNLLFASLPPVLHVKGDAGTTVRWLEANLQFVASEMASGDAGLRRPS